MFRINIIALGKNKENWVAEAVDHYLKLLKRYASVSFVCIPDIKQSGKLSRNELVRQEADRLRKSVKSGYTIALSDRGRQYNSEDFAGYLSYLMENSQGSVDFIIGGIYGLSEAFTRTCSESISLSPMTMSHQLVRAVLLEQLYRGFSILFGSKYHK